MEHLEVKAFRLKLDAGVDEAGQFDGYAAVFGNVDSQGDLIEPGAFTKTLSEKDTVPILWQHNPYEPIGAGKAEQDKKGLRIKGRLNLEVQRAREARALMQGDENFGPALGGLSIGYKAINPVVKGSGMDRTRHLPEIKLYEFSPVTFPANALATYGNVKGLAPGLVLPETKDELEALLELAESFEDEVKAGRTLSADNEAKIRAVVTLLQALLSSSAGTGGKDDGAAADTPEPEVVSTLRALADEAKADATLRSLRRVSADLA